MKESSWASLMWRRIVDGSWVVKAGWTGGEEKSWKMID